MSQTVHVLANPTARRGGASGGSTAVIEALRSHGCKVVPVGADTVAAAETNTATAVKDGAERLVVVGGDGVVHLAVQALAGTDTVLGIVPQGSGNDFARGLGLPTKLPDAVDAALGDHTAVDLMRIGSRWGASVATMGFSVAVNRTANRMRWPAGASRYSIATLWQLPRLGTTAYELWVDGTPHPVDATLVTVANTSHFGGGMQISPAADPADGLLDLTIVGKAGRLELLRWFRRVFDGSHLDHPAVTTLRGANVEFRSDSGAVWADGEPVDEAPVVIEAVAGALRVAGAGNRLDA